jgi:hypothetical protein
MNSGLGDRSAEGSRCEGLMSKRTGRVEKKSLFFLQGGE